MTHVELISTITRAVRDRGAAAALAELRTARPAFTTVGYHETIAVFYVWAVDRLVAAGRSDRQILWHPLTDSRTLQARVSREQRSCGLERRTLHGLRRQLRQDLVPNHQRHDERVVGRVASALGWVHPGAGHILAG